MMTCPSMPVRRKPGTYPPAKVACWICQAWSQFVDQELPRSGICRAPRSGRGIEHGAANPDINQDVIVYRRKGEWPAAKSHHICHPNSLEVQGIAEHLSDEVDLGGLQHADLHQASTINPTVVPRMNAGPMANRPQMNSPPAMMPIPITPPNPGNVAPMLPSSAPSTTQIARLTPSVSATMKISARGRHGKAFNKGGRGEVRTTNCTPCSRRCYL